MNFSEIRAIARDARPDADDEWTRGFEAGFVDAVSEEYDFYPVGAADGYDLGHATAIEGGFVGDGIFMDE